MPRILSFNFYIFSVYAEKKLKHIEPYTKCQESYIVNILHFVYFMDMATKCWDCTEILRNVNPFKNGVCDHIAAKWTSWPFF